MRNRRKADLPVDLPVNDPTHLGPTMEALVGPDNKPIELGNWKGMPPTLNPFHYDENAVVTNREKSESQRDREARLARRLMDILGR